MSEMSAIEARRIIETVGSSGTPPARGFQYFTAGIEPYLEVLEEDYFKDYLAEGGSTFKLLVGAYGGGKTHFLYSTREIAWRHGYPVAYVPLSHDASPFFQLDKVYASIIRSIQLPPADTDAFDVQEQGVLPLLKGWHVRLVESLREQNMPDDELVAAEVEIATRAVRGVESLQMQKALPQALEALATGNDAHLTDLLQWLTGEGFARDRHRKFGLLHGVSKSVAMSMIRSLTQWVRALGYPGICILFDEAEQIPSLSTKQRDALLSNLRELIDECGHQHLQGVLMVYAVPDENFFEGRSSVYEALNQRIASVFEVYNPTGVKIKLDDLAIDPVTLMQTIGTRLATVYSTAYDVPLDGAADVVASVAKAAYEQRFGDIGYKRLFVQGCVRAFHLLRRDADAVIDLSRARELIP